MGSSTTYHSIKQANLVGNGPAGRAMAAAVVQVRWIDIPPDVRASTAALFAEGEREREGEDETRMGVRGEPSLNGAVTAEDTDVQDDDPFPTIAAKHQLRVAQIAAQILLRDRPPLQLRADAADGMDGDGVRPSVAWVGNGDQVGVGAGEGVGVGQQSWQPIKAAALLWLRQLLLISWLWVPVLVPLADPFPGFTRSGCGSGGGCGYYDTNAGFYINFSLAMGSVAWTYRGILRYITADQTAVEPWKQPFVAGCIHWVLFMLVFLVIPMACNFFPVPLLMLGGGVVQGAVFYPAVRIIRKSSLVVGRWAQRFKIGFNGPYNLMAGDWSLCLGFCVAYSALDGYQGWQIALLLAFRLARVGLKAVARMLRKKYVYHEYLRVGAGHIIDFWQESFVVLALPGSISTGVIVLEALVIPFAAAAPLALVNTAVWVWVEGVWRWWYDRLPSIVPTVPPRAFFEVSVVERRVVGARYMLEAMVRFVTTVLFVPMIAFLAFGYNKSYYPFSLVPVADLKLGLIFVSFSATANIAAFFAMRVYYLRWYGSDVDPLLWGVAYHEHVRGTLNDMALTAVLLPYYIILRHFNVQSFISPNLYPPLG